MSKQGFCFSRRTKEFPDSKFSKPRKLSPSANWCLGRIMCGSAIYPASTETTIRAALLIQKWYRRYMARMEMKKRYSWTIFQTIEYNSEQDQMKLHNFFNTLLMHIPKDSKTCQNLAKATAEEEQVTQGCIEFVEDDVDQTGYRGPKLNFPLTSFDVKNLIELFRRRKESRLHTKYVTRILQEAAGYLKRLPNFNIASTAISKQMTVCGDIHGKLEDLLVVFHKNGLPSKTNPYIFNGDFVDRGKKSLEVFLLLLVTVMAYPGSVFLNRGNHEDSVMNARYGFIREINNKYKNNGENLMKLIEEVYRWLPLGTLINNKVLVVHGGISDTTNLDTLKRLNRSKYTSILRPPVGENKSGNVNKEEWKQIFDIMWSDPQRNEGCQPNSLRSAGTYFGPDITKSFLKQHGLEYIIRSHECKPCGYEIMHSGKVITIFSASNYYAVGSNKGAYMKVNPKLDTHFVQYTSESAKSKKLTFRDEVGLVEKTALKELGKLLHEKQIDIEREFKNLDPEDTGIISVTQWCYALEKVTNLGIPWRLLKDKLAPAFNETELRGNSIQYKKTFNLLDTDPFMSESSTSVASSLYNNRSSLEAIFKILDKDNSGYITLEEFGEACDLLAEFLSDHGTKDQVLELCKLMDLNKDGLVDLNEFLEAFRLCEESKAAVKQ